MTTVSAGRGDQLPGLSVEVLAAGAAFAVSAGATSLEALSTQRPPSALLLLGAPFLAAVGGVVLDQRPGDRVGRLMVLLSLSSVVVLGWTLLRYGGGSAAAPELAQGASELAALLACSVAIAVPWAFQPPSAVRSAWGLVVVAVVGGLLVAGAGSSGALTVVGWATATGATGAVWVLVARAARHARRVDRRRVGALLTWLGLSGAAVTIAWVWGQGEVGFYVTAAAEMLTALVVGSLWLGNRFRPPAEHLLDGALLLAVSVIAAATVGLVHLSGRMTDQQVTGRTTLFTAVLTVAIAGPAALWVRRAALARRYGSGLLAPEDVARITADLHAKAEPRDLLRKSASMVAAASGSRDASIVLGPEEPSVPEGWVLHPLLVGGDPVGALLIASDSPEGPEARQQKVIAQLLPTVALVARAVGLAVEAEHARRDVAREREAERQRVLGDLHDGLGPVLAGMSMRVQAALRTSTSPEQSALLSELAEGLSESRTDLRRIVAGITPSTLDDGDLAGALQGLVRSFRRATERPEVSLVVALDGEVRQDLQVAVYRSVAEGITNALRHADADTIRVEVRSASDRLVVEVVDDGSGGPVVHGVGLSSLGQRARGLGGRLEVCPAAGRGTRLRLELPLHPPTDHEDLP